MVNTFRFRYPGIRDSEQPYLVVRDCSLWTSSRAVKKTLKNYTVFQKSDAKIQITITTAYLTRIKYPLSGFNYHLSDVNVANFNKIHRTVTEQQLF